MAQVVNLRPSPPPLNRFSTVQDRIYYNSFRPIGNHFINGTLNPKPPRVSVFSSNNNKHDQARIALEDALGGKKSDFEKWNKEIQKREEIGGGACGGGWFGWRKWFGDGDHFWEETQQASLVGLVLVFVYLVIAKGEALLAVIFNPVLFVLRGVRNGFTNILNHAVQQYVRSSSA